jgi:predicted nucleic acid-binding protein
MSPYADTNFLTRVYLRLPDSEAAWRLTDELPAAAAHSLPVTWLHRLEFLNALQFHVFSARQPGQHFVTSEQAALALANFRADLTTESLVGNAIVAGNDLERQFTELSLRHTAKHGFRTYDLLHVSSALLLKCDRFWSFDSKASKLAALEGLKIRS